MMKAEKAPTLAVGMVAVDKKGRICLIRRRNPPMADQLSMPGGRVGFGEKLEAAARRELEEETGLKTEKIGLIDVVDGLFDDADGQLAFHYVMVDYWALVEDCTKAVAGDDAKEVLVVDLADIAHLPMWAATKEIIVRGVKLALAEISIAP